MNKYLKGLLSLLLCLCLVCAANAEETAPTEEAPVSLTITTTEEFLTFAESCRLDSYSQNLTVSLKADIDLSGTDFTGIPTFSGTLEGGGHTITGLSLTGTGSVQGLFRYLTETAVVRELTVEGQVAPQGSRTAVGGIAGSSAGLLQRVCFRGDVSGSESVGGIVGINTGILEEVSCEGTVHGSHFVGGIAGQNSGVIRQSENRAQVNTTVQQNSIGLSDITMDTLTNSEAANTVTDIGGIAGTSSGVIRQCKNNGSVGYRQMGYNIGGIAGSQSGYITDCVNHAEVSGRKEVGGIVGHMEPSILLEYSEDALQQLQQQLDSVSSLAHRAAGSAQAGADSVSSQLEQLQTQAQTAADAVQNLLPDRDDPTLPDEDALLAAQNTLSSSLAAMPSTLEGITASTESTASTLYRDMQALSDQLAAMEQTLQSAEENLNAGVYDVSDEDTDTTLTGKVTRCENHGAILADLNAGGIAGAMALENDLDPEEDISVSGSTSLNFEGRLRAVVLDCENTAAVTVLKQNAGGIVGWQSMGLIKGCTGSGSIEAENADYAGGIAGQSSGYIRGCFAKCSVTGDSSVGGIAGTGTVVTDCRALVTLSGSEKVGAILGTAQEPAQEQTDPIRGNFYMNPCSDPGAIDGISYAGQAEPLAQADFLVLEALPDLFRSSAVTFIFADGTQQTLTVPCGQALTDIPALPEKDGCTGIWENLAQEALTAVYFDMEFTSLYNAHSTVLSSTQTRQERPLLLVQGDFTDSAAITLESADSAPALEKRQQLLESWRFAVTGGIADTARFLLPEDVSSDRLLVVLQNSDGSWQQTEYTVSGSYLVFPIGANTQGFALVQQAAPLWPRLAAGGAALFLLTGIVVLLAVRKKRK